jgi:hypothetical protein
MARETGVVPSDGFAAHHDRVRLGPQAVAQGPGPDARDPPGGSGAGRGFPVQGLGHFDHNVGQAGFDLFKKSGVLPKDFPLVKPRIHAKAGAF